MKTLMIVVYTFLSIIWTFYFIQFCMGIPLEKFTVGCSLLVSALTCMTWLKDKIKE